MDDDPPPETPRTRSVRWAVAGIVVLGIVAYANSLTGAFVLDDDGAPRLVLGSRLLRWTPAGYTDPTRRRARGTAVVITPPSLVEVIATERAPLVPFLHPSAAG